jgi:hypothetical protein
MKRHPALAPLSRHHHHALVIAQRLRRATTQTAPDIAGEPDRVEGVPFSV